MSPSYVCLFIYLNIYGLFNSAASTLDCSVSDSRMIGCKECARKQLWPNLMHYPGICIEELWKTMKNLHDNIPSEIQIRHFLNRGQKLCSWRMYVRWLLYCRAYTAILHIMLLWTALFHFQELIPSCTMISVPWMYGFVQGDCVIPVM